MAADFIVASYEFDAPIDEFGLLKEPIRGHLRDLHKAIKLCKQKLVSTDPNVTYPGKIQEVKLKEMKLTRTTQISEETDVNEVIETVKHHVKDTKVPDVEVVRILWDVLMDVSQWSGKNQQ
ncbi:hypothetical protein ACFE04_022673 [Oxalis oulophora]